MDDSMVTDDNNNTNHDKQSSINPSNHHHNNILNGSSQLSELSNNNNVQTTDDTSNNNNNNNTQSTSQGDYQLPQLATPPTINTSQSISQNSNLSTLTNNTQYRPPRGIGTTTNLLQDLNCSASPNCAGNGVRDGLHPITQCEADDLERGERCTNLIHLSCSLHNESTDPNEPKLYACNEHRSQTSVAQMTDDHKHDLENDHHFSNLQVSNRQQSNLNEERKNESNELNQTILTEKEETLSHKLSDELFEQNKQPDVDEIDLTIHPNDHNINRSVDRRQSIDSIASISNNSTSTNSSNQQPGLPSETATIPVNEVVSKNNSDAGEQHRQYQKQKLSKQQKEGEPIDSNSNSTTPASSTTSSANNSNATTPASSPTHRPTDTSQATSPNRLNLSENKSAENKVTIVSGPTDQINLLGKLAEILGTKFNSRSGELNGTTAAQNTIVNEALAMSVQHFSGTYPIHNGASTGESELGGMDGNVAAGFVLVPVRGDGDCLIHSLLVGYLGLSEFYTGVPHNAAFRATNIRALEERTVQFRADLLKFANAHRHQLQSLTRMNDVDMNQWLADLKTLGAHMIDDITLHCYSNMTNTKIYLFRKSTDPKYGTKAYSSCKLASNFNTCCKVYLPTFHEKGGFDHILGIQHEGYDSSNIGHYSPLLYSPLLSQIPRFVPEHRNVQPMFIVYYQSGKNNDGTSNMHLALWSPHMTNNIMFGTGVEVYSKIHGESFRGISLGTIYHLFKYNETDKDGNSSTMFDIAAYGQFWQPTNTCCSLPLDSNTDVRILQRIGFKEDELLLFRTEVHRSFINSLKIVVSRINAKFDKDGPAPILRRSTVERVCQYMTELPAAQVFALGPDDETADVTLPAGLFRNVDPNEMNSLNDWDEFQNYDEELSTMTEESWAKYDKAQHQIKLDKAEREKQLIELKQKSKQKDVTKQKKTESKTEKRSTNSTTPSTTRKNPPRGAKNKSPRYNENDDDEVQDITTVRAASTTSNNSNGMNGYHSFLTIHHNDLAIWWREDNRQRQTYKPTPKEIKSFVGKYSIWKSLPPDVKSLYNGVTKPQCESYSSTKQKAQRESKFKFSERVPKPQLTNLSTPASGKKSAVQVSDEEMEHSGNEMTDTRHEISNLTHSQQQQQQQPQPPRISAFSPLLNSTTQPIIQPIPSASTSNSGMSSQSQSGVSSKRASTSSTPSSYKRSKANSPQRNQNEDDDEEELIMRQALQMMDHEMERYDSDAVFDEDELTDRMQQKIVADKIAKKKGYKTALFTAYELADRKLKKKIAIVRFCRGRRPAHRQQPQHQYQSRSQPPPQREQQYQPQHQPQPYSYSYPRVDSPPLQYQPAPSSDHVKSSRRPSIAATDVYSTVDHSFSRRSEHSTRYGASGEGGLISELLVEKYDRIRLQERLRTAKERNLEYEDEVERRRASALGNSISGFFGSR